MLQRLPILGFALACYAVFLATFLYLVAFVGDLPHTPLAQWLPWLASAVPYTVDAGRSPPPAWLAACVNLALLALFGLQHSLMARSGCKRLLAAWLPASMERSLYVLLASATLALLFLAWQPMPAPVWTIEAAPLRAMAWAVFAAGWALVLLSTFLIDHFELFGLRQAWARLHAAAPPAPRFVTPWLYRLVRHPLYLGFLLAFWAAPDMSQGRLLFAAGMSAYILLGIRFEERDLHRRFGEDYARYRERVRMLVPLPAARRGAGMQGRGDALPCLALGAVLLALGPAGARAAVFTIGIEADCSHGNIQNAINALPATGEHEIRLRAGGEYFQQALHIQGRRVALVGGFSSCSAAAPDGPASILDGQGGASAPVLHISGTGNFVTLHHLILRRGDAPADGHGGGIFFNGGGVLGLTDVVVANNYAGYGGGINMSAVGGSATLYLNQGAVVLANTAQIDGGGIRLWGSQDRPAELFMYSPDSAIIGNQALGMDPASGDPVRGFGGGLLINDNASANIGSPGHGLNGAVSGNTARHGGGIAAVLDGNWIWEDPELLLFTTDPLRPVRVHDNRASVSGGGIALFTGSDTQMCAYDLRLDGNRAPDGSALHVVALEHHAQALFNLSTNFPERCRSGRPVALGAVPCAVSAPCNLVQGNLAMDADGQYTTGATVRLGEDSRLAAAGLRFLDNVAGNLVRSSGQEALDSVLSLRGCLLADNTIHQRLLQAEFDASASLQDCTIAGNAIGGPEVLAVDGLLTLRRSILHQPGLPSLAPGGARDVAQVLASERASLDGGGSLSVVEGDPRFWDPEHGDYRLHAASDAVDFAGAAGGRDLDGVPYDVDLPVKPNRSAGEGPGPRDLGAFERQGLLPLVRNGRFDQDLRGWSEATPGTASWLGPGAHALVSQVAPPGGVVAGLRQCVPLPGPAFYALNAFALAPGFGQNRDYPQVRWRLRADSPDCGGPVASEGLLALPRSGSFASAAEPALIAVPGSMWTRNSTLEIVLRVQDGDLVGSNAVRAQFDLVTLEPTSAPNQLFRNGFESAPFPSP